MSYPSRDFWKAKSVLVTGHTGFKGAWLSFYLSQMGAQVHGLALDPIGSPNLYSELKLSTRLASDSRIDIRDYAIIRDAVGQLRPEVIFHLAAQALVGKGYEFPINTLSTNVVGTANLLEATRELELKTVFISVTTDKVYANSSAAQSFAEDDPLGGHDPYSASKAAADIISQMFGSAYLSKIGTPVGIARAGNVIGGGDWSKNRLFPDLVRAWSSNKPARLRLPHATRPWQHVLEPLRGYIILAEMLQSKPEMFGPINFGPDVDDSLSVEDVVGVASAFWPKNPGWVEGDEEPFYEAKDLSIDNSRAKKMLDVKPVWRSQVAIERTTRWYHEYYSGTAAADLCLDDIRAFESEKWQ